MPAAVLHLILQSLDLGFRRVGQEQPVLPHQVVRDRHRLAEHLLRRILDRNVVAERLRHLLDAVEPFEQGKGHHHLGLELVLAHQVAAHQQVEELVGPAEFDIGAEGH